MKKSRKSSKKGFTLVELIVVLVILAILAAMLVPALTGYIKRAKEEKDYQFAATVLTAAQAAATYQYAQPTPKYTINESTDCGNSVDVSALVGNSNFTCSFSANSSGIIQPNGWVGVNGARYTLQANGSWSAQSSATTQPATT